MTVFLDPNISKIEEGIEIEDIRQATLDPERFDFKNPTGSFTVTGATEDDQPKIITAVIKRDDDEGDWLALEAHTATQSEAQAREEHIRRSQ